MMAEPPLSVGASQLTSAEAVSDMAATFAGDPGIVLGVAVFPSDAAPSPMALFARTSTSYCVPLVRFAIVNGLESVPALTQVSPPVSLYSIAVTGDPPSAPSEKATLTDWLPGVSAIAGAAGEVLG